MNTFFQAVLQGLERLQTSGGAGEAVAQHPAALGLILPRCRRPLYPQLPSCKVTSYFTLLV